MASKIHIYTDSEIEYIREIAPNCTCDEIVEKFNKRFNLNQNKKSLVNLRSKHGIRVGKFQNPNSFKKGYIPWNKGMKGLNTGGEEGWFKKGRKNPSYRPVGSESKDRGYTIVKVSEPDVWERKHYMIWEKEHGEVPPNHLVIFADGDKENFSIDNLLLVSRGQLNRLVFNNLLQDDTELTKTMFNIVKVHEAIDERSK